MYAVGQNYLGDVNLKTVYFNGETTVSKGRGHPDIPIPYVLLLHIPLPVIPIPNIPTREG